MMLKSSEKNTRFISFFILLVLAISVLGSCSSSNTKTIKISAIIPLTGPISFVGDYIKEGMELAKEEVNSNSKEYGFTFEIVYGDNKGAAKETVSIIQRNINIDKIKFFMVSPTPACMAIAPIVDRTKTIMFAGSMHPYITDKSEYIFRTCVSNAEENELLSEYATSVGIKSIAALIVKDDFGQSAVKDFKDHFTGKILIEEPYDMRNMDFRQQILKVKNTKPDAILILGYGIAYPNILKQMAELGVDSPVLGNMGFSNPPVQKTLKILPQNFLNRIIFTSPDISEKFSRIIEQKFSKTPNLNQAFGYDFIKIIASEIKKNGLDIEKIKRSILLINNYTGAFNKITFNSKGDSRSIVNLVKIEKGERVPIK
ncbi:MAG: ABC transporter substrate-binding protein [Candidatus Theseobacter exili]|nr:ABC transporter substrate-binding protein [Candidatus Theseobacter exili]